VPPSNPSPDRFATTRSVRSAHRRIAVWCAVLLGFEVAAFAFIAAGTHGRIVRLAAPTTTDFVSFYAAGALADAGTPELAYDRAAHYAAEQRATENGIKYNFFYYPPVFLVLCAILARLPYLLAFIGFEVATLALYLLVASAILGVRSAGELVPVLAFPPVLWTIGLGQNAFLTAALFGGATFLVDRRPVVAGLLFGGLCYKPHFALLVPVALVAGSHWRTLAATFATAVALSLLSLAAFGWPTWHAFLVAAEGSPGLYQSGRVAFAGFVTPFGAVLLLGGTPLLAYAAQAVAALCAATLVAAVWHHPFPLPLRAAVLAAATLVAVPLALFYDLMLASIAGLWLFRSERGGLFPDWAGWGLLGLFVLSLNPRALAEHRHLPIGPLISLSLFALVAITAWRVRPKPLCDAPAVPEIGAARRP
jgi:hypothetical protein